MEQAYKPKFEWRFLGPDFWLVWLSVGFLWVMTLLPGAVRQRLAKWLARYILIRHRKRRQIVETNLAMCFPDKSDKARQVMVRRFFEYASMALLDYGLIWFARPGKLNRRIDIQGVEHIENPYLSDRRIIVLSCHTPGLEYGAIAITRRYPTVGLVKPVRNALYDWLVSRGRTRFNSKLIERSAGIRHVVRAIRKKNVFYYLPDEDMGNKQRSEFLPFFEIPTASLTTLGRLANMTHAVVVPCITHFNRRKDRYEVKFFPALKNFPSGDDVVDARTMNQALEAMIREEPEQYMWSFRLFQTRPEGESSPYER
ncbi:MAG: hypothetical protein OEY52_16155 [Gammaproteobacteria bacterium]|nr:hypothetical protein [Gammaproteobacteria bacterium]